MGWRRANRSRTVYDNKYQYALAQEIIFLAKNGFTFCNSFLDRWNYKWIPPLWVTTTLRPDHQYMLRSSHIFPFPLHRQERFRITPASTHNYFN